MVLSILLPMVLSSGRVPTWFDNMLAGYALAYDERHRPLAVRDPKSGFYLVREVECDGGDISLVLTCDRKELSSYGYKITDAPAGDSGLPMVLDKPLRNLSTGKGIAIGDSESKMRSVLGKPSSLKIEGDLHQLRAFTYHYTRKEARDVIVEYAETYFFKQGRLIEISFFQAT